MLSLHSQFLVTALQKNATTNRLNKMDDHFETTLLNSINHESLAETRYLYQMITEGCDVHGDVTAQQNTRR